MKRFKLYAALLTGLMVLVVFAGCGKQKVANLTEGQVSFAEPIAEKMLAAQKDGDYEKFSENFDDIMKSKLDENAFITNNELIKTKVGDYQSKEFTVAQSDSKYTVVVYNAKYTNEPAGVKVTISFSQKDGKYFVSGFFEDSPNLRK